MGVRVMKRITSRLVKLFLVLVLLFNSTFVYANTYLLDKTFEINKTFLEVAYKLSDFNALENVEIKEVNNTTSEEIKYTTYSNNIDGNSIRVASIYNHLMKDDGSYYYLDHGLDGTQNGIGVPFIDQRTNFGGRKTIIYAHSSLAGNGPFNALQNYHYNKNYYDNNKYITINYEGNTYTYEIFSVYVSVANSEEDQGLEYYRELYYSDEDWERTINWYKSNSDYDTGVSVNKDDKILILQTCSMDPNFYEKYYRYNLVIMGKLI